MRTRVGELLARGLIRYLTIPLAQAGNNNNKGPLEERTTKDDTRRQEKPIQDEDARRARFGEIETRVMSREDT